MSAGASRARVRFARAAALVVAGLGVAECPGQLCTPTADTRFASGHFDGAVLTAALFDDGSGAQWHLGGTFARAGGVPTAGVCRWVDRRNYAPLSVGVTGGEGRVAAVAVHDPDGPGPMGPRLVVAGNFLRAGGRLSWSVASWDGSAWSPVGMGLQFDDGPAEVRALAVHEGVLYAGGLIDASGPTMLANLARLGASGWEPVASGVPFEVLALASSAEGLLVAGDGPTVYRLDGSGLVEWATIGGTTPPRVNDIVVGSSGVVVAGRFGWVSGTPARNVAWIDGSGARALGAGVGGESDEATCAAMAGDELIVGGRFAAAGGIAAANVARWSGEAWSAMGAGLPGPPARLIVTGEKSGVAALGSFADGRNVRVWDVATGSFRGLDAGLRGPGGALVRAMVGADPGKALGRRQLFIAGGFTEAGRIDATSLVRFDGEAFHAVPSAERPESPPRALARLEEKEGDVLLVGGSFTSPWPRFYGIDGSGTPRRYAPEPGLPGDEVRAILALADSILVGGSFRANGTSPQNFARWSLFSPGWSAHEAGTVNGAVNTLAAGEFTMDGVPDVFGGGLMTQGGIGGPTAPFPLQNGFFINGATRTMNAPAVNGFFGIEGQVLASAVPLVPWDHTNYLFIGGEFTRAGGISNNRVAPWHGNHWHFMAQGVNGPVRALAMFDDGSGNGPELYVAGEFTSASGLNTPYLAKWDGTEWAPVLSGLDGPAHALAVHDAGDGLGECLYIAGQFSTFGGVSSQGLARLIPCRGCAADWNFDGTVDFNDFLAYLNDFNAGLPRADLNRDGTVDFNDLLAFLNLFSAGC